jgi:hypothetical protein
MNSRRNILAFCGLVFLTWSCVSTQRFTALQLDILRPAKLDIPETQKNVGIIYRNVVEFEDITGFLKYFDHADNPTEIFSENPVAYHYLEMFTKDLIDSERFENIEYLPAIEPEYQLPDSSLVSYLTPEEIRKYEYLHPQVDIFLFADFITSNHQKFYFDESQLFVLEVYTSSIWQLSGILKDTLIYRYAKTDTLAWEEVTYSLNDLSRDFPSVEQALIEGAGVSALGFARLFHPYWETVNRMMYISGNYEMKMAQKYATNNQWKEASAIWEKYTNNKNKNIAAKAMFNMALACEVSGEIDNALDWVIKSYMVFHESNEIHSFNTKDYISLLALRKREYQVLDKQLKN